MGNQGPDANQRNNQGGFSFVVTSDLHIQALCHQAADNFVKQKKYPLDSPKEEFYLLVEAFDVVSVSELVELGSKCAFLPLS